MDFDKVLLGVSSNQYTDDKLADIAKNFLYGPDNFANLVKLNNFEKTSNCLTLLKIVYNVLPPDPEPPPPPSSPRLKNRVVNAANYARQQEKHRRIAVQHLFPELPKPKPKSFTQKFLTCLNFRRKNQPI